MRLIKDVENIKREDKELAYQVMNRLRHGSRVFGNPAEGLKITLRKLEKKLSSLHKNMGKLDFMIDDSDIKSEIAKIKAGITGEETLAEYFERIVKYDEKLEDIVLFASLSDPYFDSGDGEYISDSDFVALYGRHVLVLDAKNISTHPEIPIYLKGNELVAAGGVTLLELHPSAQLWNEILQRYGCNIESVRGCVVIVNKTGAIIWKNKDWHKSSVQPVHISDLVDYLHDWIKDKEPTLDLSTVTVLSKMQIRKETKAVDMTDVRRRFRI